MTQNLQQKYQQLQRLCKKQQAQIIRLQKDLRERYQSYLLYTSRYKKQQMNPSQPVFNLQKSIKPNSTINKQQQLSRSRISSEQSKIQSYESSKKPKILRFDIVKSIDMQVQPDKQVAKVRSDEIMSITQSFKNRIAALNNAKTQAVKKCQKNQNQIKHLKQINHNLTIQMESIRKSQKKLKDKLKKIPQYEQRVDSIYTQLISKIKLQEDQGQVQEKHIHDKLEKIISWINENKQKNDQLHKNNNVIENNLTAQEIITKTQNKPVQQPKQIEQQYRPNFVIESVQSFSHSPQKQTNNFSKQSWTIVSRLNEVDINPFQPSEIKEYNLCKQIEKQNQFKAQRQKEDEVNEEDIYEQQLRQSQNQIKQLYKSISRIKNENKSIEQQKKMLLQKLDMQRKLQQNVNQLRQQLQKYKRINTQLAQQLKNSQWICSQYKQQFLNEKKRNNEIKQQLQNSRRKYIQLQESRLTNTIQSLKQSSKIQKMNLTQADISTSKVAINQQLQAPYFVEEDLQHDSNHQYVKRSFIRKKIVKRNLSATTYRIVSKSKEEVEQIISNKVGQYRDKSREKAAKAKNYQKSTKQAKLQALQNSVVNRVSEVSEPRDSNINTNEEVKIIEVTTITPNQVIQTAKIYSKGNQSNLSTRRKF